MSKPRGKKWIDAEKQLPEDRVHVDVWFDVWASPLSFGIADSWCEPDCWRDHGKWFHVFRGEVAELESRYISHWKNRETPKNHGTP